MARGSLLMKVLSGTIWSKREKWGWRQGSLRALVLAEDPNLISSPHVIFYNYL